MNGSMMTSHTDAHVDDTKLMFIFLSVLGQHAIKAVVYAMSLLDKQRAHSDIGDRCSLGDGISRGS